MNEKQTFNILPGSTIVVEDKNPERPKAKKKHKYSATKFVLYTVVLSYIWGVVLGSYIAFMDNQYISDLLTFIGVVTPIVFGFYAWKAKHENLNKYPKWNDHNMSE